MKKLKDVIGKINSVQTVVALFGATREFHKEYQNKVKKLGEAIAKEQGVTLESAMNLSEETPLGKKSTKMFAGLCVWLKTQHENF